MELNCQRTALDQLRDLANIRRQSVLIEGPKGSGKSYLAKYYANMIEISDFVEVVPKVNELKAAIDEAANIDTPLMICVENIDLGVISASYTLLKILEEPLPNLYIVITCRNVKLIPDTIVSRSAVVSVNSPTSEDIVMYSKHKDEGSYKQACGRTVWKCVRTFSDADCAMKMTADQFAFYDKLQDAVSFNDSVSNIVWNISHYGSNAEANITFVILRIMDILHTPFVIQCCLSALDDLAESRIAQHAVLSKLIFNLKYCE